VTDLSEGAGKVKSDERKTEGPRVGSKLTSQDQNDVPPVSSCERDLIWLEQPRLAQAGRDRGGGARLGGGIAEGVNRELGSKPIGSLVWRIPGRRGGGGGGGGHRPVAEWVVEGRGMVEEWGKMVRRSRH